MNLLRQMIDDEILDQRAAKLNLAASDEDVNAKLIELKAPYTQEEFDKKLKQQNMTLDDLKQQIRRKLTADKLINKEIESKINITDADISGYYTQHKSEFNVIEPQYHLAWIVVTTGPSQQPGNLQNNKATSDADARKKIQTIHNRLTTRRRFRLARDELFRGSEHKLECRRYGFHCRSLPCSSEIPPRSQQSAS